MPPSHHSSSSHSSHSSSFHSSHSSSRSYSSSSSRSYSSGGGSSYSRGPSSHSSTSRTSSSSYSRPSAPTRPRVNQPAGYRPTGGIGPRYVYGRRHDYVYYPAAWIDDATGRSYEKGYYDENGQRYDDVSFSQDGKYKNVVCHCPYCGQDTVLDLTAEEAKGKSLQCPSCGAPMEIKSELDEYVSGGGSAGTRSPVQERRRRRGIGCLVALGIFVIICIVAALMPDSSSPGTSSGTQQLQVIDNVASNLDLYGETVYLKQTGPRSFRLADAASADMELPWDADSESYCSPDETVWIWWNTDVEPPVWQYWVEGISSDYGDYGWMEHDQDGWFIEKSYGNWIEVPAKYDTDSLWYIED